MPWHRPVNEMDELEQDDFTPKKRLGQNFLIDPSVPLTIAEAVPIEGKKVLEIGAGHGELTRELSAKVGKKGKVVSLEVDAALYEGLEALAKELGNVQVACQDALKFSFKGYPVIFGNLPYYISTPLVLKIAESGCSHSVILLQEEFGKRLCADSGSGDYSRLSLSVGSRYKAEIIDFVPKESFDPQPRVDSVLVKLTKLPSSQQITYDPDLVRMAFCHKNKSLLKAIEHSRNELGKTKPEVRKLFSEKLAKWAGARVKDISPSQWQEVSKAWDAARQRTCSLPGTGMPVKLAEHA